VRTLVWQSPLAASIPEKEDISMESNEIRLKANAACCTSGMWLVYLIMFAGWYLGIALISLLRKWFPYANLEWLWFLLLLGVFACLIGDIVVMFSQWAWIEKNGVCVTFGKKPIWGMAASQLQFIAMVGGDMGNSICLSAKTIDELAELREQQLLRNWFSKDEVPLRKRRAEWRQTFAREYLLKGFGKGLFAALRPSGVVMLAGNHSLLTCIRALYPNVPYYNMTAAGDRMNFANDPARIPLFYDSDYYAHLREDGVHICHFKKEIGILPKTQIKTIICMHDYRQGNAGIRFRAAAMICSQTVEELAALCRPLFLAQRLLGWAWMKKQWQPSVVWKHSDGGMARICGCVLCWIPLPSASNCKNTIPMPSGSIYPTAG
jgi:hypothetical protein